MGIAELPQELEVVGEERKVKNRALEKLVRIF